MLVRVQPLHAVVRCSWVRSAAVVVAAVGAGVLASAQICDGAQPRSPRAAAEAVEALALAGTLVKRERRADAGTSSAFLFERL